MRLGTAVISCVLALVSVSCVQSARPAKYAGDVRGRACMEVLPSLDVSDAELTEHMRMARMLSAESLELPPPVVPSDTSAASLSRWSEGELRTWLQAKQKRAEAARAELNLAALENHRQRILAGALVGLVFEDVARTLLVVPTPSELAREPEIAEIYRELTAKQAEPYLMHSRLAYAACAGNASGELSLSHWSDFCSARGESLPEPVSDESESEIAVASP